MFSFVWFQGESGIPGKPGPFGKPGLKVSFFVLLYKRIKIMKCIKIIKMRDTWTISICLNLFILFLCAMFLQT